MCMNTKAAAFRFDALTDQKHDRSGLKWLLFLYRLFSNLSIMSGIYFLVLHFWHVSIYVVMTWTERKARFHPVQEPCQSTYLRQDQ